MGNQISRPQQGDRATYGDAGPYSGAEWAWAWSILFAIDPTEEGVLGFRGSELEVSSPTATSIRVASGAALVQGHLFINLDASDITNASDVDFAPTVPGIALRSDRVVIVQNNTNNSYDGTADGVVLDFPTDLTDYGGSASVPPHSARLAILLGDAVTGAEETLIQDAGEDGDIWMIEIASYDYDTDPSNLIDDLTDTREFLLMADKIDRQIWVPATYAYNDTDGSAISLSEISFGSGYYGQGFKLPDSKDSHVIGRIALGPDDYVEDMECRGVYYYATPAGVANIYGNLKVFGSYYQSTIGALNVTSSDTQWSVKPGTYGSSINDSTIDAGLEGFATSFVTVKGVVDFQFERLATDVLDTVGGDVYFLGWSLRYKANN